MRTNKNTDPRDVAARNAGEISLHDIVPILFLADVGLMFVGLFVANAMAWWVWLPFYCVSIAFAVFVVWLGHYSVNTVARSVPFQWSIGSTLFLSSHAIMLFGIAPIPLPVVGYLLFAAPISSLLLFDCLHGDGPEIS